MADQIAAQPIRSDIVGEPVVVSRDLNQNEASNVLFTQLSDGTTALSITSGALDVNVDNTVTVTATDFDIRDLSHTQVDSVRLGDGTDLADFVVIDSAYGATPVAFPVAGKFEATPTVYADGDATPFLTDSNGRLQVDAMAGTLDDSVFTPGVSTVSAAGFFADEAAPDSVDEGDVGAARMTLDRKQLIRVVGSTDADRWEIDSSGLGQIDVASHALTNANAVPISADNAANAETNPIFVQVVSGVVSGIEVVDFDTAAAVAKDATSNHDITVTGASTMKVQCIIVSASSAAKWEVQSGPLASLVTEAVNFTSASNQNSVFDFKGLLEVPDTGTGTVRIIRTNRDNQAQDVYSTLIATEV